MAGGRPTLYKPEDAENARQACMAGATSETLARRFAVLRRAVDSWIATRLEYGEAVQQGRAVADLAVVSAHVAVTSQPRWKKTLGLWAEGVVKLRGHRNGTFRSLWRPENRLHVLSSISDGSDFCRPERKRRTSCH